MSAAQLALAIPIRRAEAAPQRVALPDPVDDAQAESRYQIVRMLLDFQDDPSRFGLLRLADKKPVTSFSRMVRYVSETCQPPIDRATLLRWLSRYREGGRPGLADRKRRDKGESRFFATYPKAGWLAAYLYLECRQSCTAAYEAIKRDPQMVGVPEDRVPSYETVRAWLNSMPKSLATYARNGRKAYRERMSPFLRHGHGEYSNQIWVGMRNAPLRIDYDSLVQFLDDLRARHGIKDKRKPPMFGRHPDNDLLPFPWSDTMSVEEAAETLNIHRSKVLLRIESGLFEAYQLVPNSTWRISRTSFASYIQKVCMIPRREQPYGG
jgi:excisionase family DNA binding protein